ncbi:MAG: leucine-rich repeat domain-containing protein [Ruminococcus sp.]|nr:leucine-rich repeat domain-containing protein [Ruminococcus sp.]
MKCRKRVASFMTAAAMTASLIVPSAITAAADDYQVNVGKELNVLDGTERAIPVDLSLGSNTNVTDGVLTLNWEDANNTTTLIDFSKIEGIQGKIVGFSFDCEADFSSADYISGTGGVGFTGIDADGNSNWIESSYNVSETLEGSTWHEVIELDNPAAVDFYGEDTPLLQIGWWWGSVSEIKISNFNVLIVGSNDPGTLSVDLSAGSNTNVEDGVLTLSTANTGEPDYALLVPDSNATKIPYKTFDYTKAKVTGFEFDCEAPFSEAGWVGGGGAIGLNLLDDNGNSSWVQADFSAKSDSEDSWHQTVMLDEPGYLDYGAGSEAYIQIGWWWGAGDELKISNFKVLIDESSIPVEPVEPADPEEPDGFYAQINFLDNSDYWYGNYSSYIDLTESGHYSLQFSAHADAGDETSETETSSGLRYLILKFPKMLSLFENNNASVTITGIYADNEALDFDANKIEISDNDSDRELLLFSIWNDEEDAYALADSVAETVTFDIMTIEFDYKISGVIEEGDYTYAMKDDGTLEVVKYTGTDTDITVPSSAGGYEVTSVGSTVFRNNKDIVSIQFPDSITEIGDDVCYDCTNLQAVILPNELERIPYNAFRDCKNLRKVVFPEKLVSIESGAFENCTSLTSVTIPEYLKTEYEPYEDEEWDPETETDILVERVSTHYYYQSIGWGAFKGCTSLEYVSIPENSLSSISGEAFLNTALTEVTIPRTVTYIGDHAFGYTYHEGYDDEGGYAPADGFKINCYKYTMGHRYATADPEYYSGDDITELPYELLTTEFNDDFRIEWNEEDDGYNWDEGFWYYTGEEIIPDYTFTGDYYTSYQVLEEGVDYTVEFENNINGGEATVTFTGIGDFEGSATQNFTIAQSMSNCTVKLGATSFLYNGENKCPSVKVYDGTKLLKKGVDYTVDYWNASGPGTATVYIEGIGNYKGYKETTYTIKPNVDYLDVELGAYSFTYNGKAKCPSVKVSHGEWVWNEDTETEEYKTVYLKKGVDYTVEYKDNVDITDEAKVIIKGIGEYGGTTTNTFTIHGKDISKADITLGADTFKYNGKAKCPSVKVVYGGKTLTKGVDYKVSYYNNVNVSRTYKWTDEDGNEHTELVGGQVYIEGLGDYAMTYAQKSFTITGNAVYNCDVTLGATSFKYNGKAKNPSVKVYDPNTGKYLVKGTDFTVKYVDNVEVGYAHVEVTGIGKYMGTAYASYQITGKTVSDADVELKQTEFTYNGKAKCPAVSYVKVYDNSTDEWITLKKNVDYTVSYEDNVYAGYGKVVIKGIGDYSGTTERSFRINGTSVAFANVDFETNDFIYTGEEIKPNITLYFDDDTTPLTEGVDYTLSYENNIEPGTATVIITGLGKYKNTKNTVYFWIYDPTQTYWGMG